MNDKRRKEKKRKKARMRKAEQKVRILFQKRRTSKEEKPLNSKTLKGTQPTNHNERTVNHCQSPCVFDENSKMLFLTHPTRARISKDLLNPLLHLVTPSPSYSLSIASTTPHHHHNLQPLHTSSLDLSQKNTPQKIRNEHDSFTSFPHLIQATTQRLMKSDRVKDSSHAYHTALSFICDVSRKTKDELMRVKHM